MLTKVAPLRSETIDTEVLVLGWADQNPEELSAIKADIGRYVSSACNEGFTPRDMLQDVLDKYPAFFGPVGEVDRIDRPDRTVVTFFLRARKGI